MKSKAFNITAFQQESEQWKVDVIFCRDEIKVLNRYLQEVMEKNVDSDMKDEITQFQRKLSEKIDKSLGLMSAIEIYDEMLSSANPEDQQVESTHAELKGKVAEFCETYSALKSSFVRFLARADFIV